MDDQWFRRDLLKLLGGATVAGIWEIPGTARMLLGPHEPGAPLFFTRDEFALLDALTELIIPTDSHSPGAHDAGVAVYIDKTVAESFLPEDKQSWRKGLALMNEMSHAKSGKEFLKTTKQEQIALLTEVSAPQGEPTTAAEKFFNELKTTTTFAYYSSSIGIHQEMEYKGNTLQQQFSGYEAT